MSDAGKLKAEDAPRVRALCLLSGGLDSQLAICVLREQGVDVLGVTFDSPFFNIDAARRAADALGIQLHVVDFSVDIIDLLRDPPHGFGSCLNPCVDCHARMLRRAGEMLQDVGAGFLATGEVLDERPMSQNRGSLQTVARGSGFGDLVLRPLSAKRLAETTPEEKGWVDREKLLGLDGRGRKYQMELAQRYGLKDAPSPAGGCRLTEPNFCKRLEDLMRHEGISGVRAVNLLRYGRHFRLDSRLKAIVGRDEGDNAYLEGYAELYDLILKVEDIPGPVGLVPYTASEDQIRRVAAICARYSDSPAECEVTVKIRSAREIRRITVLPASRQETERLRV